jgi:hypothetical protein
VLLADLKEALVRLLEAYDALAAISMDRIIEEIWAEIARLVPLICHIPHSVLGMEHLVPLTSRQGMPSGFTQHHDYLGGRIIIINEDGWRLVKWDKGWAERAADEHYKIAVYLPAIERDWLPVRALLQVRPSKAPPAAKAPLTTKVQPADLSETTPKVDPSAAKTEAPVRTSSEAVGATSPVMPTPTHWDRWVAEVQKLVKNMEDAKLRALQLDLTSAFGVKFRHKQDPKLRLVAAPGTQSVYMKPRSHRLSASDREGQRKRRKPISKPDAASWRTGKEVDKFSGLRRKMRRT